MIAPLSLARWLDASRPSETPIAWLDEQTWTLGHLRYDVAQWVERLQQHDAERWALCFEDSYLFLVALLATLHAHKIPVIPGHSRSSLLNEQRALFDGVLSDRLLDWHGPSLVIGSARRAMAEPGTFCRIAGDACVELFTSGSTGKPKRVIKPIAHLDREAELLAARFATRLEGCRIGGLGGASAPLRSHLSHLSADGPRPAAPRGDALLRRAAQRPEPAAPLCVYQQPGVFETPRSPSDAATGSAHPLRRRPASLGRCRQGGGLAEGLDRRNLRQHRNRRDRLAFAAPGRGGLAALCRHQAAAAGGDFPPVFTAYRR
ncbi:Uncharacterised protein [Raoultella terrigena]|uniref:Uncharacterized protein n=1 Tax=Raoultella terrigena TaxID=577 RepID=A0A4U9D869_RAOTE|nr:Uncharacterised protein [Raoultella terrigena]